MKINSGSINAIYVNNYITKETLLGNKDTEKIVKSTGNDTCQLSSVGKELNRLSIEDDSFGVDEKRLNEIKDQVNNGTYSVDSTVLAKAMMRHMKGGQ